MVRNAHNSEQKKEESKISNKEAVEIIGLQVFDRFATKIKKLLKEKCDSLLQNTRNLSRKGVLDKALRWTRHHAGQQMAQKSQWHSARNWPYKMALCHLLGGSKA